MIVGRVLLAASMLAVASPASAHVGQGLGFSIAGGFAHPFLGLDHLATMVAVGLWAALAGGKRLWVWPAAFVSAMLMGGFIGHAGIELPARRAGDCGICHRPRTAGCHGTEGTGATRGGAHCRVRHFPWPCAWCGSAGRRMGGVCGRLRSGDGDAAQHRHRCGDRSSVGDRCPTRARARRCDSAVRRLHSCELRWI